MDAFSLLTIEVFLLTVYFFYLRWGNRKYKDQIQFPDKGEQSAKRSQSDSLLYAKDQTEAKP